MLAGVGDGPVPVHAGTPVTVTEGVAFLLNNAGEVNVGSGVGVLGSNLHVAGILAPQTGDVQSPTPSSAGQIQSIGVGIDDAFAPQLVHEGQVLLVVVMFLGESQHDGLAVHFLPLVAGNAEDVLQAVAPDQAVGLSVSHDAVGVVHTVAVGIVVGELVEDVVQLVDGDDLTLNVVAADGLQPSLVDVPAVSTHNGGTGNSPDAAVVQNVQCFPGHGGGVLHDVLIVGQHVGNIPEHTCLNGIDVGNVVSPGSGKMIASGRSSSSRVSCS